MFLSAQEREAELSALHQSLSSVEVRSAWKYQMPDFKTGLDINVFFNFCWWYGPFHFWRWKLFASKTLHLVRNVGNSPRPFSERLRHIAPYPDVIRQVEDNFQGKGGLQRSYHAAKQKTSPGRKPQLQMSKRTCLLLTTFRNSVTNELANRYQVGLSNMQLSFQLLQRHSISLTLRKPQTPTALDLKANQLASQQVVGAVFRFCWHLCFSMTIIPILFKRNYGKLIKE